MHPLRPRSTVGHRHTLRNGLVAALSAVGLTATAVSPAGAATAATNVACGAVITTSTTLAADVSCSGAGNGIVIGADNITLDLAGHRVARQGPPADNVGVRLRGRSGVTITGGTVSGFATGVAIQGGGNNTVSSMHLVDNVGVLDGSGNFGDGVGIFGSSHNVVSNSTVARNGPFEGIGVFGNDKPGLNNTSVGNVVKYNVVEDNAVVRTQALTGPDFFLTLDDGVNLGQGLGGSSYTTVLANTIQRNGLHGIDMCSIRGNPCNTANNTIKQNLVQDNGFTNLTTSDPNETGRGISVNEVIDKPFYQDFYPPTHDVITANSVLHNASTGLYLGSKKNLVTDNYAMGNGAAHKQGVDDVDFELNIYTGAYDCTVLSGNVITNNIFGTYSGTTPIACLKGNTITNP